MFRRFAARAAGPPPAGRHLRPADNARGDGPEVPAPRQHGADQKVTIAPEWYPIGEQAHLGMDPGPQLR